MTDDGNGRAELNWKEATRKISMSLLLPLLGTAALTLLFPYLPMGLRWPVRVISAVTLVLSLAGFVTLSRMLVEWWPAMNRLIVRLEWPEKWRWRWECLLAAALVLVAAVHFFLVAHSMAAASLTVDEIGTIKLYSSKGPATVITDYGLAKNHIFFNLLNSLLPGSSSFDSLRARSLSLLAMGITWAGLIWYGWKRKRLLEFALVVGLVGLNQQLLELNFRARGYGFIFCFAAIGSLAVCEYLRTGKFLWLLGLTTALGTYTVPSYLIFGGSLLLLLFLVTRRGEVFRAGLMTLVASIFLLFPVLVQMMGVTARYQTSDKGGRYINFEDIQETLHFCIPPFWSYNALGFFAVLAGLTLAPVFLRVQLRREWRAVQIVLAATLFFVTVCMLLQTPPIRVTAFLAAPLLIALALNLGAGLRLPLTRWLQPWVAALIFGSLTWWGVKTIRGYEFLPPGKIKEVSRLAVNLTPPGGVVWVSNQKSSFKAYLEKHCEVLGDAIPEREFQAGKALLVEYEDEPRVQELAKKTPTAMSISFMKRPGKVAHRLWIVPSPVASVGVLQVDGRTSDPKMTDGNFESGVSLAAGEVHRIDYQTASSKARSLNLWSKNGWANTRLEVTVEDAQQRSRRLEDDHVFVEDRVISVDLRDLNAEKIHFQITSHAAPVELTEVFAVSQ